MVLYLLNLSGVRNEVSKEKSVKNSAPNTGHLADLRGYSRSKYHWAIKKVKKKKRFR